MGYVIALDQGDYYEARGGYDWGRTSEYNATVFDTREQAARIARYIGVGRVEEKD